MREQTVNMKLNQISSPLGQVKCYLLGTEYIFIIGNMVIEVSSSLQQPRTRWFFINPISPKLRAWLHLAVEISKKKLTSWFDDIDSIVLCCTSPKSKTLVTDGSKEGKIFYAYMCEFGYYINPKSGFLYKKTS